MKKRDNGTFKGFLSVSPKSMLWGALSALLVYSCASLVLACVFLSDAVPDGLLRPVSSVTALISTFIGGYVSGRVNGHHGFAAGGLAGSILFLLMLFFGLAFKKDTAGLFSLRCLLVLAGCCGPGVLGGIIGVNSKIKTKHKM